MNYLPFTDLFDYLLFTDQFDYLSFTDLLDYLLTWLLDYRKFRVHVKLRHISYVFKC